MLKSNLNIHKHQTGWQKQCLVVKVNSETGEKYPDNAVFADLSPTDSNAVSKQSRAQELEDKIKEFQAQTDATVGSQEYILKTADTLRKEYNQQVKDAGLDLDAKMRLKELNSYR